MTSIAHHSATTQILLPGQTCVADGPFDHFGMYAMHYAFRRDLDDLVAAAAATPPTDAGTWRSLASYWEFFADMLHHHHTAEDDHYWPVLAAAVTERGDDADRALVSAMGDEHARIGSALARCGAGFAAVASQPSADRIDDVIGALDAARTVVLDHMAHEETETLPLVQRVLYVDEYARVERAIGRSYPVAAVVRLVPWALYGLDGEVRAEVWSRAELPQRVLYRLGRTRFARRHAAAFGYL